MKTFLVTTLQYFVWIDTFPPQLIQYRTASPRWFSLPISENRRVEQIAVADRIIQLMIHIIDLLVEST